MVLVSGAVMCYDRHMRVHIELEDAMIRRVDAITGDRGRSEFIRGAVDHALQRAERMLSLRRAIGAAPGFGEHLDRDWIRTGRRESPRRHG